MKNTGELTDREENFAQCVVNGHSLTDSYKANYDTSNFSKSSIYTVSSAKAREPRIAKRIAELRAEMQELCMWSRFNAIEALRGVIKHSDRGSEIINAVKELNSLLGIHPLP